jgi:pyruvate kinase
MLAKIERARALDHLDALVAAADGVLVARGDLGVEIPIERVPLLQKRLVRLANRAAKPVIVATQMLRSMVTSPLPTRAEATDVANAVLDGADAVMLSEETAVGQFPVEAVGVMQRILRATERELPPQGDDPDAGVSENVARAACALADQIGAAAIVVATRSGFSARNIARHRPRVPVVALTPDESTRRRLSLVWGVTALATSWFDDTDALLARFRDAIRPTGLVPAGAPVVVIAGWPFADAGTTNLLHVTAM